MELFVFLLIVASFLLGVILGCVLGNQRIDRAEYPATPRAIRRALKERRADLREALRRR